MGVSVSADSSINIIDVSEKPETCKVCWEDKKDCICEEFIPVYDSKKEIVSFSADFYNEDGEGISKTKRKIFTKQEFQKILDEMGDSDRICVDLDSTMSY